MNKFFLCLYLILAVFGEDKNQNYKCPPCNSSCDTLTFDHKGICPECQMALIPAEHDTLSQPEEKIANLLRDYDFDSVPGMAVGVYKNGNTVYQKGFGSANLDYNIPITSYSKFYIGSMAKQFVGAALLQLEYEKKVDFSKPIQYYLPDFPEYSDPITVYHIIHHMSGIRGTSSMQLIAGIDQNFEDYFSAEEQYNMIKNQKSLNFKPGTEFRYSSGGYIVLAKLIERITGTSLRTYLQDNIFTPLGMKDTFVIDNHKEVVQNRVTSYFPTNNGFERRSLVFDGKGDGSILTTINDLLKWDNAFYNDSLLGVPNFAEKMYRKGVLNNGKEINYGMALSSYDHKGLTMISHNGGMLGYRADLIRFPEQHLSVAVLSNQGFVNSTGIAEDIADFYLIPKNSSKKTTNQSSLAVNPVKLSGKFLKEKTGKYFSEDTNSWRRITLSNDTLYYDSGSLDYKTALTPMSHDRFYVPALDRTLSLDNDDMVMDYGTHKHLLNRFDDTPPKSMSELEHVVGYYYSDELETMYHILSKNGKLLLTINNNAPIVIYPDPTDARINWNSKNMVWIGIAMIRFISNEEGQIEHIIVGDNRVKGIRFKKLNKI